MKNLLNTPILVAVLFVMLNTNQNAVASSGFGNQYKIASEGALSTLAESSSLASGQFIINNRSNNTLKIIDPCNRSNTIYLQPGYAQDYSFNYCYQGNMGFDITNNYDSIFPLEITLKSHLSKHYINVNNDGVFNTLYN